MQRIVSTGLALGKRNFVVTAIFVLGLQKELTDALVDVPVRAFIASDYRWSFSQDRTLLRLELVKLLLHVLGRKVWSAVSNDVDRCIED